MLIVTHEMDFALSISDRVIFMENGIVQNDAAPHAILADQCGERVRKFMGLDSHSPSPHSVSKSRLAGEVG